MIRWTFSYHRCHSGSWRMVCSTIFGHRSELMCNTLYHQVAFIMSITSGIEFHCRMFRITVGLADRFRPRIPLPTLFCILVSCWTIPFVNTTLAKYVEVFWVGQSEHVVIAKSCLIIEIQSTHCFFISFSKMYTQPCLDDCSHILREITHPLVWWCNGVSSLFMKLTKLTYRQLLDKPCFMRRSVKLYSSNWNWSLDLWYTTSKMLPWNVYHSISSYTCNMLFCTFDAWCCF